jgi:mannose-6-phosphate isomerase
MSASAPPPSSGSVPLQEPRPEAGTAAASHRATATAPVPYPVERVHRPWGWYETLIPASGAGYCVKRLWLEPRGRISLQRHHHRSEDWVVAAGSGLLECGEARIEARPGVTLAVPQGAMHRACAGAEGLLIIEVQRGSELREDDIERFADDYGRASV